MVKHKLTKDYRLISQMKFFEEKPNGYFRETKINY